MVPAEQVPDWAERTMNLVGQNRELYFALMHMARRTGDRYRDLPDETRQKLLDWMVKHDCPE